MLMFPTALSRLLRRRRRMLEAFLTHNGADVSIGAAATMVSIPGAVLIIHRGPPPGAGMIAGETWILVPRDEIPGTIDMPIEVLASRYPSMISEPVKILADLL